MIDAAARCGNLDALMFMALYYEDQRETEPDTAKAVNYYICAAVLGHKDAKYNLSRFLDEGIWLLQDTELAALLCPPEEH